MLQVTLLTILYITSASCKPFVFPDDIPIMFNAPTTRAVQPGDRFPNRPIFWGVPIDEPRLQPPRGRVNTNRQAFPLNFGEEQTTTAPTTTNPNNGIVFFEDGGVMHTGKPRQPTTAPPEMFNSGSGDDTGSGIEDANKPLLTEGSGNPEFIFFPDNMPSDRNIVDRPPARDPQIQPTVLNNEACELGKSRVLVDGICYDLLSQGPCYPTEWLVLDEFHNGNQAVCKQRPCDVGQVLLGNECVDSHDIQLCPSNEILYVFHNGQTECDCDIRYLRSDQDEKCYQEYERGSCGEGQYLQLTPGSNTSMQCIPNSCGNDGYILNDKDGKCYKKVYLGFCRPQYIIFKPISEIADCGEISIRTIFEVPTLRSCPLGQSRDYSNRCRTTFKVPTVQSYLPDNDGCCPSGFYKDPRGKCRKVVRLFG